MPLPAKFLCLGYSEFQARQGINRQVCRVVIGIGLDLGAVELAEKEFKLPWPQPAQHRPARGGSAGTLYSDLRHRPRIVGKLQCGNLARPPPVVEISGIDKRASETGGKVSPVRHELVGLAAKILANAAQRNAPRENAAIAAQGKLRLRIAAAHAIEAIHDTEPVRGVEIKRSRQAGR